MFSIRISFFVCFLLLMFLKTEAQNLDSLFLEKIEISGNKKTKIRVIEREIPIETGDYFSKTYLEEILVKVNNNLKNTGLFNFVNVHLIENGELVILKIDLEERWYFWPYPILEHADRNVNAWLSDDPLRKLNYGLSFTQYNFRGRDEILRFKVRLGYKEQFAAEYSSPAFDKNRDFGLNIKAAWFRQHKAPVQTIKNDLLFFEDENNFVKTYSDYEIGLTYRPEIYLKSYLTVGYNTMNVSDELLLQNQNYSFSENTNTDFFKVRYTFIFDKRDYIYFPTNGYSFRISGENKFFPNQLSQKYLFELITDARVFTKISNRVFLANGLVAKKSLNKPQPYFMKEGFGFEYNLRGYEYYVIDGNNFSLNSNSLYYNILPMKIREFSFIPFDKFRKIHYSLYANLFFDTGMVFDKYAVDDSMLNEFLYSFGAGMNLVTYYDRVFRIDFSVNKKLEPGIYIHFVSPI